MQPPAWGFPNARTAIKGWGNSAKWGTAQGKRKSFDRVNNSEKPRLISFSFTDIHQSSFLFQVDCSLWTTGVLFF